MGNKVRLEREWQGDGGSLEPVPRGAAGGLGVGTRLALARVGVALAFQLDRGFLALLAADRLATPTRLLDLRAAITHFVAHTPVAQVEGLVVVFTLQFILDLFAHVKVRVINQEVSIFFYFPVKFVFFSLLFS